MHTRAGRRDVVVGIAALAAGAVIGSLLTLAVTRDESGEPAEIVVAPTSTNAPDKGARTTSGAPTPEASRGASSMEPPPLPPPSPPGGPSRAPARFDCSVRLEQAPGSGEAALIVVQAPPEVTTVWGMITSGEQRTAGPINLVGGYGQQVVSGFAAEESTVVVYGDPSMDPGFIACRT